MLILIYKVLDKMVTKLKNIIILLSILIASLLGLSREIINAIYNGTNLFNFLAIVLFLIIYGAIRALIVEIRKK